MIHKLQVRTVVRADQSPINAKRWCLLLTCGHEVWITASRKPRRMKAKCDKCPGAVSEGESNG